MKPGYTSGAMPKGINPNKLFNDLCGIRKKPKMDVPAPTVDEVKNRIGVS